MARNCQLEDIRMLMDVTEYWTVAEDGIAESFEDSGDGDFNGEYQCMNCGNGFSDPGSWGKAKKHLEGKNND